MKSGKIIGQVRPEESQELKKLQERKTALSELTLTLADAEVTVDNNLYNKLVDDTAKTLQSIKEWWSSAAKKYGWEGHSAYVDFSTGEVYSDVE